MPDMSAMMGGEGMPDMSAMMGGEGIPGEFTTKNGCCDGEEYCQVCPEGNLEEEDLEEGNLE